MSNECVFVYQGANITITSADAFGRSIHLIAADSPLPVVTPNVRTIYLVGFPDDILTTRLSELIGLNKSIYNLNLNSKLDHFARLAPWDVFKSIPKPTEKPKIPEPKPLLGDHVEKVLHMVGADKAAKVYERITKKPCNCGRRKEILNNIHRQYLGQPKVPLPPKN